MNNCVRRQEFFNGFNTPFIPDLLKPPLHHLCVRLGGGTPRYHLISPMMRHSVVSPHASNLPSHEGLRPLAQTSTMQLLDEGQICRHPIRAASPSCCNYP